MILSCFKFNVEKQPSRGVARKRCSENLQQIYKKINMPKCDFNTTFLKSHFSMGISRKFAAYFQKTFS